MRDSLKHRSHRRKVAVFGRIRETAEGLRPNSATFPAKVQILEAPTKEGREVS